MRNFRQLRTQISYHGEESGREYLHALSNSERHRLQRAFVRFETYRKLFGGFDQNAWQGTMLDEITEQHRKFISRFPAWELEELNSVYGYLFSRFEEIIDNLEDTLVTNLQTASENDKSLGDYTDRYDLGLIGLTMFQKMQKQKQSDQIAHMVELGLPFLTHILGMNMADRMAMVASFAWKNCSPSLSDVLQRAPDNDISDNYSLRELGHVFWDKERLDAAGLLGFVHKDIGLLPTRRERENPSVEERLQGIKIREGALLKTQPSFMQRAKMQDWFESIEY